MDREKRKPFFPAKDTSFYPEFRADSKYELIFFENFVDTKNTLSPLVLYLKSCCDQEIKNNTHTLTTQHRLFDNSMYDKSNKMIYSIKKVNTGTVHPLILAGAGDAQLTLSPCKICMREHKKGISTSNVSYCFRQQSFY
jgi:hypothetical protein